MAASATADRGGSVGLIFVAGVHAVGKTTACKEAARVCAVPHYSASSLIKNEKQSAIPERGKAVADICGNQELLIRGARRVLADSPGRVLLDGHFTLPNLTGEIEKVEFDVFRGLNLDCSVIFKDDPMAIASRLAERDGEIRSVDLISRHQLEELAHAERVSSGLGVPLFVLDAFDTTSLIRTLRELS
jgi:adenylate kinase